MRAWPVLILSWMLAVGLAPAAERPSIYAITSGVNAEAMKVLPEKFSGTIAFDSAAKPSLDPDQLLARLVELEKAGPLAADVLLLGAVPGKGSLPHDVETLHAIVAQVRKMKLEMLWMNTPSVLLEGGKEDPGIEAFNPAAETFMNQAGVSIMDARGFAKTPLRPGWTVGRAQTDYLLEALDQWWWVCCRQNPFLVREKLWPGGVPAYKKNNEERINKTGRVDGVSMPELVRYVSATPPSGTALIFFPGGGYGQMGFLRNVDGLGKKLSPLGITLFALKYRTGRGDDVPLIDAERAVRWVRFHAKELGIDPNRVGVAGISAGANLTLNLISRFTPGNPQAEDPLDRLGSRPDFAVVLTSWHHGSTQSPFVFSSATPPVFLRHARNDPGFPLAETVVAQLQDAKVPLNFLYLDKGGHGAFDQGPDSLGQNWTDEFVPWLRERGFYNDSKP